MAYQRRLKSSFVTSTRRARMLHWLSVVTTTPTASGLSPPALRARPASGLESGLLWQERSGSTVEEASFPLHRCIKSSARAGSDTFDDHASILAMKLPDTPTRRLDNEQIARMLEEAADLLEAQGANPYRVRAYRNAARTLRDLKGPVSRMVEAEGVAGLLQLPAIGRSLAHTIEHLVRTGRFGLLERLKGDDAVERVFATVPNIGPELARRIHEQLGIETLAELEAAAYDGRLAQVPGMGKKRLRAVRESLAGRFARRPALRLEPTRETEPSRSEPAEPPVSVAEILDVDREYREKARRGELPRIAPRRFNPTRDAWLPILHTERDGRHYTALYSNTARAHELGTTRDWVVIYRDDHGAHDRWTVITSQYGALKGKRIVRGREDECREYYGGEV